MKFATSISALFSHRKRRHYSLYLQLATGSSHSKVSVDPQTGTLHKLMPFRHAVAHNYRLGKFFATHLSLPPSTVVTSPDFKPFVGALCSGYPVCKRTIHKICALLNHLLTRRSEKCWKMRGSTRANNMWHCRRHVQRITLSVHFLRLERWCRAKPMLIITKTCSKEIYIYIQATCINNGKEQTSM